MTVPLRFQQDDRPEPDESILIGLADGDLYALSAAEGAARVTILANEGPIVTVAAEDDRACEGGSDPSIFVLTRTGPTTESLQVVLALFRAAGETAIAANQAEVVSGAATLERLTDTPISIGVGCRRRISPMFFPGGRRRKTAHKKADRN